MDQDLIRWAVGSKLPVLVLLTKADKLKSGKRNEQLMMCREASMAFCGDVTVHAFSSLNGLGLDNLQAILDNWFQVGKD